MNKSEKIQIEILKLSNKLDKLAKERNKLEEKEEKTRIKYFNLIKEYIEETKK